MPTRRSAAGFSLIELMIVVTILGILAAITFPVVDGFKQRALIGSALGDAHCLKSAFATEETFPFGVGDYEDLVAASKGFCALPDPTEVATRPIEQRIGVFGCWITITTIYPDGSRSFERYSCIDPIPLDAFAPGAEIGWELQLSVHDVPNTLVEVASYRSARVVDTTDL